MEASKPASDVENFAPAALSRPRVACNRSACCPDCETKADVACVKASVRKKNVSNNPKPTSRLGTASASDTLTWRANNRLTDQISRGEPNMTEIVRWPCGNGITRSSVSCHAAQTTGCTLAAALAGSLAAAHPSAGIASASASFSKADKRRRVGGKNQNTYATAAPARIISAAASTASELLLKKAKPSSSQ